MGTTAGGFISRTGQICSEHLVAPEARPASRPQQCTGFPQLREFRTQPPGLQRRDGWFSPHDRLPSHSKDTAATQLPPALPTRCMIWSFQASFTVRPPRAQLLSCAHSHGKDPGSGVESITRTF